MVCATGYDHNSPVVADCDRSGGDPSTSERPPERRQGRLFCLGCRPKQHHGRPAAHQTGHPGSRACACPRWAQDRRTGGCCRWRVALRRHEGPTARGRLNLVQILTNRICAGEPPFLLGGSADLLVRWAGRWTTYRAARGSTLPDQDSLRFHRVPRCFGTGRRTGNYRGTGAVDSGATLD